MARAEEQSAADLKKQKQLAEQLEAEDDARRARRKERILCRKLLAEHEPVPFHALDHALRQQTLSHAYLFAGPAGTLKKEMAVLLAQSLFCGSEGLIEEDRADEKEAGICLRTAEQIYPDFILADGENGSISKEEVDALQVQFSNTAVEASGIKVYLLNHVESMSISAMNSLLKFLEEPTEHVYAILTVDNLERILPTIISRCVQLPFQPLPDEVYASLAETEGLDEEDLFFLSRIARRTSGFGDAAASETYQTAKQMLKQFIGAEGDPRQFLADYDLRWRIKDKDDTGAAKDRNLETLLYFFGMLEGYFRDIVRCDDCGPAWYHERVSKAQKRKLDYGMRLRIAIEARDRCNRTNDLNLVLDQAVYRMEDISRNE